MDDTPAELSLNNLNVKSGATLLAQAELQDAVSLNVDDVVGYAGPTVNSAVGGVLDCTRVTLNIGSTLALDNAHFDMNGGTLTLAVPASASGRIELVLSFDAVYTMESQVMLFSNLGTVNFIFDNITATPADATTYTLNASDYFVGAGITAQSELVYDSNSNVLYLPKVVPESSTTTLGAYHAHDALCPQQEEMSLKLRQQLRLQPLVPFRNQGHFRCMFTFKPHLQKPKVKFSTGVTKTQG